MPGTRLGDHKRGPRTTERGTADHASRAVGPRRSAPEVVPSTSPLAAVPRPAQATSDLDRPPKPAPGPRRHH
jgi:hypothetical protein